MDGGKADFAALGIGKSNGRGDVLGSFRLQDRRGTVKGQRIFLIEAMKEFKVRRAGGDV